MHATPIATQPLKREQFNNIFGQYLIKWEGPSLRIHTDDLGRDTLGNGFKPIREDGDIGPKTSGAFRRVLPAAGNDNFTSKLGENLGFFDDDETLFG